MAAYICSAVVVGGNFMKRFVFGVLPALCLSVVFLFSFISCTRDRLPEGYASLVFSFGDFFEPETKAGSLTLPDTNDFILYLSDASGKYVYSGLYGDKPERFELAPGSYTAKVISREFNVPAFDAPQFGDEVCFVLEADEEASVQFGCAQLNSGVKLVINSGFISDYDGGVLFLTSSDGRLMYSYNEKRIAYFNPGAVSLKFLFDGAEKVLFTKVLDAREILIVNLGSGDDGGGVADKAGISISVDTSRVWNEFDYSFGGDKGGSIEDALSVDEARGRAGEKGLWVCGYIVGGDLTSSGISFAAPFRTYTNLAIAASRNVRDRDECLSVSLPVGDVRDGLNLVDNPGLLGKRVFLKGNIVASYFGLVGIKDVTEYEIR